MLKELLQMNDELQTVGLSGVIDGLHYHTVFVPFAMSYQPYVLFEDSSFVEVKTKKKNKITISTFEHKEKIYTYNTQSQLWFQEGLVNTVSNEGIKRCIENESINAAKVYEKVRTIITKYYDFILSEELDLAVCHTIHSYILGIMGKTLYLLLDGERNTGKSTLQKTLSLLQFNGCFSGKSTVASIVRKVHFLRASINIDEFEKMDKEDQKVITGILNTGAYASGTREITNLDAKNLQGQIQIFQTFGTKTFSVNRANFDTSFLSRCIVINTARNTRSVKNIHHLSEEEKSAFQQLRDDLFIMGLKQGMEMYKAIQKKQTELDENGLFGRRGDIIAIICGIKKYCTNESDSLQEYLLNREEMESEDSNENDRYFLTLKFLLNRLQKNSSSKIEFSNKELLEYLLKQLDMAVGCEYAPTSRSVGALLKRSKLVTNKKDRFRQGGTGNFMYCIPIKRVIDLVKRSGQNELIQMLPPQTFTNSQLQIEAIEEG